MIGSEFAAEEWARQACPPLARALAWLLQGLLNVRAARQVCPLWSSRNVPAFELSVCFLLQVIAVWKWFNHLSNRPMGSKEILRLNLDESSICLFQGAGKGNVFVARKRRVVQFVTKGKRRACFTHIAVICDRSELQPLMPQFLVSNLKAFPARKMARLRNACPPNVILVRQRSAWNNRFLCACVIRRIAGSIGHLRDRYQPVLLLDASRIHTARVVIAACVACGIWVVLVPPSLTFLLQPLDTHAFRKYKHWLRSEFQRARCEIEQLDLSIEEFLPCVYSAVRFILQGIPWAAAFDENGFGAKQARVSDAIKRRIGAMPCPRANDACPTDAEITLCFPRGTVVPFDLLRAQLHPPLVDIPRGMPIFSRSAVAAPRGSPLGRFQGHVRRSAME